MSCRFFSFPSSFAYLNPFQQWLYDFEIHLFTLRTTEGLEHNYSKRFKHSLMLQKEARCIKSWGVNTFEFEDQCKLYLICFPGTCKYLLLISKASTKLGGGISTKFWKCNPVQKALNASCFVLEHQWMWICRTWRIFLKNRAQFNCSE